MWWREGAALQGLLFRFAHVHRRVNAGRLGTVRRQREFRHDVTGRPQQFVSNILCAHSHLQTCLDTFALFVQSCRYSTSWTPDDERNGRSKHVELYKNCRINTYRKCILLVCLYNKQSMLWIVPKGCMDTLRGMLRVWLQQRERDGSDI